MKKKILMTVACLTAIILTACSGRSETESIWQGAEKSHFLMQYVQENQNDIDMETLKKEAGSSDSSLNRQFKATVLLCALEYAQNLEADSSADSKAEGKASPYKSEPFKFDYPISAPYANAFLSKVNTDEEKFWKAMKLSFSPNCYELLLAASDNLDEKTVINLNNNMPFDSGITIDLKNAMQSWAEKKPLLIVKYGSSLTEAGLFEAWEADDYKSTYFTRYNTDSPIQAKDADQAIQYVSYLRSTILPSMKNKFGEDELNFNQISQITAEDYISTRMTVTIEQPLQLKAKETVELPETIETEGKKTVAFFRNTQAEEFEGSPPALLLVGDFMLNLPEDEIPQSLADTDYYLILTPNYQYGDTYTIDSDYSNIAKKGQTVNCDTSIDLYDAKTGAFLRHLCDVKEKKYSTAVTTKDGKLLQYPQITSADILCYIYKNMNEPDTYNTTLSRMAGLKEYFKPEQTVSIGNWEITYHSSSIIKSFDDGFFRYTAEDGNRFVKALFTIKNIGSSKARFLPQIYDSDKTTDIRITDADFNKQYDCSIPTSYSKCLNGASLKPGESEEGELFFEVPEQMLHSSQQLYFEIFFGDQYVYYPLSK